MSFRQFQNVWEPKKFSIGARNIVDSAFESLNIAFLHEKTFIQNKLKLADIEQKLSKSCLSFACFSIS